MLVLGVAPGFPYFGFAIIESQDKIESTLVHAGVLVTREVTTKGTFQQVQHIGRLHHRLSNLTYLRPRKDKLRGSFIGRTSETFSAINDCAYVAVEEPSWGPKTKNTYRGQGIAWGVLVSVVRQHNQRLYQVSTEDVKQKFLGKCKCDRRGIEAVLVGLEGYEELQATLERLTKRQSKRKMAVRAVGAAITSLSSVYGQSALRLCG